MIGSGKLSVATRTAGSQVEIDVADNGPGIAEELLPVILRSVRDDESIRRVGRGSGSRSCAASSMSLGGTVKVRTKPGAGSVFTVVLPVHPAGAA